MSSRNKASCAHWLDLRGARLVGRHHVEVNPQATNDMAQVVEIIGVGDKASGWGSGVRCPSMVGICSDTYVRSFRADNIVFGRGEPARGGAGDVERRPS